MPGRCCCLAPPLPHRLRCLTAAAASPPPLRPAAGRPSQVVAVEESIVPDAPANSLDLKTKDKLYTLVGRPWRLSLPHPRNLVAAANAGWW